MRTITAIAEMRAAVGRCRLESKTIGLVPTMGCLHEGHLSLVRESLSKTNVTVVSVFVNPLQFGPREDLQAYPRDLRRDSELLEKEGVDFLFNPQAEDMFPAGYKTFVEVLNLQDRLCGRSRPGHFRGVTTVVLKLFNIVGPDFAFFGWKDAQQLIILKKMTEDLNLSVRIEGLPLVRDLDGLALSSRNRYLSADERLAALVLTKSLSEARSLIEAGEKNAAVIIARMKEIIGREPQARIDTLEIVETDDLLPLDRIDRETLIALAVFIGRTRLIDNIRISSAGREQ